VIAPDGARFIYCKQQFDGQAILLAKFEQRPFPLVGQNRFGHQGSQRQEDSNRNERGAAEG
jgi:hypothetical protein